MGYESCRRIFPIVLLIWTQIGAECQAVNDGPARALACLHLVAGQLPRPPIVLGGGVGHSWRSFRAKLAGDSHI